MFGLEAVGEPAGPVVVPDRFLEGSDPVEIGSLAHLSQRDAVGQDDLARDPSDRRDHDRLHLLGHEALCDQPLGQIRGLIVSVQLPFELLAAIGEHTHLSRDQRIELGPVDPTEVAVRDAPAAPQVEEAHQRTVSFDAETLRQRIRDVGAQLGVVESEQIGSIEVVPWRANSTSPGLLVRAASRASRSHVGEQCR